jgi:predicted lipoprotein with Yx(FWY)xxD motif
MATAGGGATAQGRTQTAGRTVVTVVKSKYGRVVADGRGQAIYVFSRDRYRASRCNGACAKAWPPFLTTSRPRAGKGVAVSALGTLRRPDGRLQVTYSGRPLYYYNGDRPGVILCQNVNEFGGNWLVLAPTGHAIH